MLQTVIRSFHPKPGQRILVTSDVHGYGNWLQALLVQLAFSADDVLVIIGDLIEKGPDSLGTLRQVMRLECQGNVYVTMGNVDAGRLQMLDGDPAELFEYIDFMRRHWGGCLFDQMAREISVPLETPGDAHRFCKEASRYFDRELSFLRSRPTILETPDYIFVHSGIPHERLWELKGTAAWPYLKTDLFMRQEYCFDRWVIVGDMPSTLYNMHRHDCNPIVDHQRHKMSIDGGCGLNVYGQLNMLCIQEGGFDFQYYDNLPKAVVQTPQQPSADSVQVTYLERKVALIQKGPRRSLVRHVATGRELWVRNSWLRYRDGQWSVKDDYTDYKIGVQPGDVVSVVLQQDGDWLIKKDGIAGWYTGDLELV